MRKKSKWMNNPQKIFIAMMLATAVFLSCADDQDATNASADSASVSTTDTDARQRAAASARNRPEPHTMDDSTVTRLALLEREANQYRYRIGNQFVIRLPNNVDSAYLVDTFKFGKWYEITTLTPPITPRNRELITLHIHGYLKYHDMVVKQPAGPHTLFLQWHGDGKGSNIRSATVWISPGPVFSKDSTATLIEYSDPPRPKVPPPPPME